MSKTEIHAHTVSEMFGPGAGGRLLQANKVCPFSGVFETLQMCLPSHSRALRLGDIDEELRFVVALSVAGEVDLNFVLRTVWEGREGAL